MIKHISCDCKCKISRTTHNSNQKWNNDKYQCECKQYYSWNPSTCICENSRYLKSIVDDSVIVHDEVINVTDIASTNVTNTLPSNITV